MTSLPDAAAVHAAQPEARPPLARPPTRLVQWRPAILTGRRNRIEATGVGGWLVRLGTSIWGDSSDNLIRVGHGFRTKGLAIRVAGKGNRIEIGDDVAFSGWIEIRGFGSTVRIGDRCDFKRTEILACHADVEVGRDCLVASGVRLRSSDMHGIVDRASGLPVNAPKPVFVGDNVWLGADVALLKGAHVADGCVVGLRSVVTRRFDEADCVIAGAPARVVRRGIAWSR